MKRLWLIAVLVCGFSAVNAQCDHSELYPADTVQPILDWVAIDNCSEAGQYALINVMAGKYYAFSTQSAHGSDITYDSQLTLRATNGDLLAYNDDTEANNLQSLITWTAPFTGTVELHLSEYDCQANDSCGKVMVWMSDVAGNADLALESSTLVYPNPSAGAVSVVLTPKQVANKSVLTISNVLGQVVFESNELTPLTTIDLTGQKGVFLVTLHDHQQRVLRSELLVIE